MLFRSRWINYSAIGWLSVIVTGFAVSILGDSPLKAVSHRDISEWGEVEFLTIEKYNQTLRGSVSEGTPFKIHARVMNITEEQNVYQCELMVKRDDF